VCIRLLKHSPRLAWERMIDVHGQLKNFPNNELWKRFIENNLVDTSAIRPEILASWQRCKGKVDPYKRKNSTVLCEKSLEDLRKKTLALKVIALPVMEKIYSFVRGSGFLVSIAAVEGSNIYNLESIGDEEIMQQISEVNFVPGSNCSEEIMGTMAVNLAVYLNRPFQVFPNENYCLSLQNGTTAAAPIHDPDTSKFIGVLVIVGKYKNVHPHTLGIAVAAVDSIEKQLTTSRLRIKTEIDNYYTTQILENSQSGQIALDKNMTVTRINRRAYEILGIKENLVNKNIMSIFSIGHIKQQHKLVDSFKTNIDIVDESIHLNTLSGIKRIMLSTHNLIIAGRVEGKIFKLQEMSHINDIVMRNFGNYAKVTFNDLIGQDNNFLNCIKTANQVSDTVSTVLLVGETGTGKDLFAQAIHNASRRSHKPYIAINCAAIPRELLSSELFGYEEGSFTGARKGGNPGKFELADGGTLFLDEIGDMPLDMQTALLRILEEKTVTRLGGKVSSPVDVRIIGATNMDLAKEVEKGHFRKDLYYRLNVIRINIPPLRERKGDIPLLLNHLIQKISGQLGKSIEKVSYDFALACSTNDWPGNVRELQNTIEMCIILAKGSILVHDLLPEHIRIKTRGMQENQINDEKNLKSYGKNIEQSILHTVISKCDGNKTLAAKELGISRTTLYRKMNVR